MATEQSETTEAEAQTTEVMGTIEAVSYTHLDVYKRQDGYIVRELSRMPSNFRCEGTIQDFMTKNDIPGIAGIDTRALTKIRRLYQRPG